MKAIKYFFIRWYYRIFFPNSVVKIYTEDLLYTKYNDTVMLVSGVILKYLGDNTYIIIEKNKP